MMRPRWALPGLVIALLAGALLLLRGLDRAPVRIVAATDHSTFSAERAFGHLRDLIGENVAHPPGSAAQRRIEARILGKLATSGYSPEVQAGLQCSPLAAGCTQVRNIVAVRKGREGGPAVMLTAHYDSVPGSAAAADDGAGVAAMLDIADLLATRAPLRHDVVLLFADGEESGLRGAMFFAQRHPLMRRVGLVVNLEARGVSGPSAMFETGAGNEALIRLFGEVVARPAANSLLYEVYRRMPNDTDFSVYRRDGQRGFNFAFTRGASLYHSSRDDLAHLDLHSLQHQGDNALAVLLGSAEAPFASLRADRDASYVDIATRGLLAWPATWNAAAAAILFLLTLVIVVRRLRVGWRPAGRAWLSILAVVLLLPLAGWLLSWPLGHWPDANPLDHPHPWPGRIALIAAALLVVLACARWLGREAGVAAVLGATWILVAILTLAIAVVVPGAAWALLLPLLVFALVGLRWPRAAAALAFAVAAWSSLYVFLLADVVLGFKLSQLKMLPLLVLALPLLPLAVACVERGSSRRLLTGLGVIVLAASLAGWWVPAHTFDRPRGVNLVHVQEEGAAPLWYLEGYEEPGRVVLDAMQFPATSRTLRRYGVQPREVHAKPAPPLAAPPPALSIDDEAVRDGRRIVRATLRSQRDAFTLLLALPEGSPVEGVRVEGQPVIEAAAPGPRVVGLHGLGYAPVRIELTARAGLPLEIVVLDIAPLVKSGESARLMQQRPAEAAPLQNGDQSIALRRVRL